MKRTLQPASPAVLALLAVLAAATLAVGGCSAEPSAVIPKSEPTFKPVFKSDAEALAAAEKDYAGYLSTAAEITESSTPNVSLLDKWATARQVKSLTKSFARMTDANEYQTGAMKATYFSIQKVDQSHSGLVSLTAYVCTDETAVHVFDQTGRDVTPADSPPILANQIHFKNLARGSKVLLVDGSSAWTGRDFC